jgi:sarcosine oxidase
MQYDAAVVGLGVMGAATAGALAARGARVVAFDRYTPPHDRGSSHGRTRIIREAYFEQTHYVPLVQRAFDGWAALERAGARRLYVRTGGLMCGPEAGTLVAGTLASVRAHDLDHEQLDAAAIAARFPGIRPRDSDVGVLETRAGVLLVEDCLRTLLAAARAAGARLYANTAVEGWDAGDGGVVLRAGGERVRANRLIIAAGAWLGEVLGVAAPPHEVERQVVHWFTPRIMPERYTADRMPVLLWQREPESITYTLPDVGHGVKIAVHHQGEPTTVADVDRTVRTAERSAARTLLAQMHGDADWQPADASVCLYTNTSDRHFVIDVHPAAAHVVIISACSGHGFKFAPAIGAIAAELALDGGTLTDIAPFRMARLEPTA